MHTSSALPALGLVASLSLGGCGAPQAQFPAVEPGQIRVVQSGTQTWYEHVDGPSFRGERGKGLIQAVAGHEPATALAIRSRRMRVVGGVLRVVAASAIVGGFLTWSTTLAVSDERRVNGAVFSLLGVGVAVGIGAGVVTGLSEKKKWSAVESFNTWVVRDGSGYRDVPRGPGETLENAEPALDPMLDTDGTDEGPVQPK